VAKVERVAAALPVVSLQGQHDAGGISFGPPPFISGTRAGYDRRRTSSFGTRTAGRSSAP